MPRPHIEFIQAQALPWKPSEKFLDSGVFRPGAEYRMLSADPDSRACSTLFRYPPNWQLNPPHALKCDEEFFVVDGEIIIGEQVYGPGDYGYLPAGYLRKGMKSKNGTVILTFFEGRPDHQNLDDVPSPPRGFNADALIEHLATKTMDWGGATEPVVAGPRVGRKALRPDTDTGERTWILSMHGSDDNPIEVNGVEQHPCVEEMYLLSGSFHMTCGVMHAGAYFWRPPMIPHGPMGSKESFLALFRAKEGAFETHWSNRGAEVQWDQPYSPTLPAGYPKKDPGMLDTSQAW